MFRIRNTLGAPQRRAASGGNGRTAGAADDLRHPGRAMWPQRSGTGGFRWARPSGRGAARRRRPRLRRKAQEGRKADAEHPAERAQRAADLWGRFGQGLHRRIVEQGLQLARAAGRRRCQPHEPGAAARQPLVWRRGGPARVAGRRRGGGNGPAARRAAICSTRRAIRRSRVQIRMTSGPASPGRAGPEARAATASHSAAIRRAKRAAGVFGAAGGMNGIGTRPGRPGQATFSCRGGAARVGLSADEKGRLDARVCTAPLVEEI